MRGKRIIRVAKRLDVDDGVTYIIVDKRKARKLLKQGMWMIKIFRVSDSDVKKIITMQSDKYVVIH
jgi:hypothetical protein